MRICGFICVMLLGLMGWATSGRGEDRHNDAAAMADPRDSALVFAVAFDVGDKKAARSATVPGGEQTALVDLLTGMVESHQLLVTAAVSRFGESGASLGGAWAKPNLTEAVQHAKVETVGDEAKVRVDPEHVLLFLHRDGDRWRVDVAKSFDPKLRRHRELFARSIKAAIQTSEDISQGKISDLDGARAALKKYGYAVDSASTTKPGASR